PSLPSRQIGGWRPPGGLMRLCSVVIGSPIYPRWRAGNLQQRPAGPYDARVRAAAVADGEIRVEERPDPEPGKGEVLVAVRAAGVNGADMLQRAGRYPAPPGSPEDIPGLELAGEVAATGPGAERFAEGDRVMAIVGGGGQAELALVHERAAMPVPDALDWPAAGGTPEVFVTAHDALFTQASLESGEHLLVHGGAGGVGTAAIQLGRGAGARVTATVRREELRPEVES